MWKKIRQLFNNILVIFRTDSCYSEMEESGYAAMGCCGGMVGGDRNTGFLSYSCISCPHLVLTNERRKDMSKTETTVIANVQVTMIVPGDVTSKEDRQRIANDICKKLEADDVKVKDVKVFLMGDEQND